MEETTTIMDANLVNERAHEFSEYTIRGNCYENQGGTRIWEIIVNFRASDQVSQAWIVGGEGFRTVEAARQLLTAPQMLFEVTGGKDIGNIDPALKQSVLTTIQKWENEPTRP